MQSRGDLKKEFDPRTQNEIFFTMKVYATKSKKKGKLATLKYSIDFHPPFEANTNTIEPYASPLVGDNKEVFARIFHNVNQVFRFISDPDDFKYEPFGGEGYAAAKKSTPAEFRVSEQEALRQGIKLAKNAINHVTYEMNSPAALSVGAVFRTTGNGDLKPPPPGVE